MQLGATIPAFPVRSIGRAVEHYLTRFRDRFKGGLKRLLDQGAVFTNANLEHYPTVTAVGHSTMLSGATPASER